MMRQLTLMAALTAASFGYNATASGFYTKTELAPSVSFMSIEGNPSYPGITVGAFNSALQREEISLLGVTARQTFGYTKWVTLDTTLSFAESLGGMGTLTVNSVPANAAFFEAVGESYASLPLVKERNLLLEPTLGFGYLWLNVGNMMDGGRYGQNHDATKVFAYGPLGGLFARMYITDCFSMRFGLAYQITQMRTDAFNAYGALEGKPSLRGRRHGLLGRLRFDHRVSSFMAFMLQFEHQAWSASGTTPEITGAVNGPVSLLINRSRISWGVNFNY